MEEIIDRRKEIYEFAEVKVVVEKGHLKQFVWPV